MKMKSGYSFSKEYPLLLVIYKYCKRQKRSVIGYMESISCLGINIEIQNIFEHTLGIFVILVGVARKTDIHIVVSEV